MWNPKTFAVFLIGLSTIEFLLRCANNSKHKTFYCRTINCCPFLCYFEALETLCHQIVQLTTNEQSQVATFYFLYSETFAYLYNRELCKVCNLLAPFVSDIIFHFIYLLFYLAGHLFESLDKY